MNFVANQIKEEKAVRLIYRLQHIFFAVCIVLGIIATLIMVVTSPQYYGSQSGPAVMVTTFATASTFMMQVHLIGGILTVYLLPLSFLSMAWLAMRRSPWLASIVLLIVFVSLFPIAAFSAQDALTNDLAHMGNNPLFTMIAVQFNYDGVMNYYNGMFIIGTVVAPTLIGIALWRTRVIPVWAAVLITFSRLLVFVYPVFPGLPVYLQIISWGILLIGSIPAALAMAKVP